MNTGGKIGVEPGGLCIAQFSTIGIDAGSWLRIPEVYAEIDDNAMCCCSTWFTVQHIKWSSFLAIAVHQGFRILSEIAFERHHKNTT
jgi:hypothetical protein